MKIRIKKTNLFLVVLMVMLALVVGCKKPVKPDDPVDEKVTLESLSKKYGCISLSEAITLSGTTKDEYTSDKYYICGEIVAMANPTWGNLTISDGTNNYDIYGSYSKDGSIRYDEMEEKPVVGDLVVYYGELGYYKAPQMKNGWIIEFYHEKPVVNEDYKKMSVSGAREADLGELVIIKGVVAQITYANGKVPNGFFVVDETEAIYVYDRDIASQVKVGNTVEVAGTKTYYINEDEKDNANKYGYIGCCQIMDVTLLDNDNKKSDFNTTWIKESTMKEIVECDVSKNVTTTIYKVNALIKRVPGDGFVNYYINDLDGKTGSYVYTACNGSDFTWLDQYDGKLCTLYVSPINAKSTASGCVYRLVPIKVVSDDYKFDLSKVPEFVMNYHVLGQFLTKYSADPIKELVTNVSSNLLGFNDAKITYTSSKENVVHFATEKEDVVDGTTKNDKIIMHTGDSGEAVVTITVEHNSNKYSASINIVVEKNEEIETITVKEALETSDNEIVTVKGIVLSSLVNQVGFYLIDETGVIAVKTNEETIKLIEQGNMIIVRGTRTHFSQTNSAIGQSCLLDSELVVNLYGSHDYPTTNFITDKTVADLVGLPTTEDYSMNVYVVTGKLIVYATSFATTYEILDADGSTYLSFYAASGKQYSWLEEFVDKEVTLELALCNWNKKTQYKGCVISVTYDGKKVINTLNFSK